MLCWRLNTDLRLAFFSLSLAHSFHLEKCQSHAIFFKSHKDLTRHKNKHGKFSHGRRWRDNIIINEKYFPTLQLILIKFKSYYLLLHLYLIFSLSHSLRRYVFYFPWNGMSVMKKKLSVEKNRRCRRRLKRSEIELKLKSSFWL